MGISPRAVERFRGDRMPTKEEILEEDRKVRRLQIVVNLVMNVIRQSDLSIEEAAEMVANTRQFALRLFPDKELAYDLIYQSRFKRLLAEKYKII